MQKKQFSKNKNTSSSNSSGLFPTRRNENFSPASPAPLGKGTEKRVICLAIKKNSLILGPLTPSNPFPTGKEIEFTTFFNVSFDKNRLKTFVVWFLKTYGQKKTIHLLEKFKEIGFGYATQAGISLGIDDLKIPPQKTNLLYTAQQVTNENNIQYKRGEITGIERLQQFIDTWHQTSENLKKEVVRHFEATDILNPVYMMAFSGARGNISQVRQLVGMRGLMADPQGQIIDFPIRSNFREGLTLTEYIISTYGARKGIVDTALRTANAGYLTRRLVDVAQHVIVSQFDCGTNRGIVVFEMKEGTKTIYALQNRLIGRILAKDVIAENRKIASRNEEISADLAVILEKLSKKILIRSPLTCATKKFVCQLCYGWSLATNRLVSVGEAVGVIAAQSIGEPGTQLTMRTFHTGGVFSGGISDQIIATQDGLIEYASPIAGACVRTPQGDIAFLTKSEGSLVFQKYAMTGENADQPIISSVQVFKIPTYSLLFVKNGQKVVKKQMIAQFSSAASQESQRGNAEQTIYSEYEGEVYNSHINIIEKPNEYQDINFEAWGWGYLWVLAGKIYQLPVESHAFPIPGDFVGQSSVMNQVSWVAPDSCVLKVNQKKEKDQLKNNIFSGCNFYDFNSRKNSLVEQQQPVWLKSKERGSINVKPLSAILQTTKTLLSKHKHTNRFAQKTVNKLVVELGSKKVSKTTRRQNLKKKPTYPMNYFFTLYRSKTLSRSTQTLKTHNKMKTYLQNADEFYQNQMDLLLGAGTDTRSLPKILNSKFMNTTMYKNHSGRQFSLSPVKTEGKNIFDSDKKLTHNYPFQQIYLKKLSSPLTKDQFGLATTINFNAKKFKKVEKNRNLALRQTLLLNYASDVSIVSRTKKSLNGQLLFTTNHVKKNKFLLNFQKTTMFNQRQKSLFSKNISSVLKGLTQKTRKLSRTKVAYAVKSLKMKQKNNINFYFNWSGFSNRLQEFKETQNLRVTRQKELKEHKEKVLTLKKDVFSLNLKNISFQNNNYVFHLNLKDKISQEDPIANKQQQENLLYSLSGLNSNTEKKRTIAQTAKNTYNWKPVSDLVLKWSPTDSKNVTNGIFTLSAPLLLPADIHPSSRDSAFDFGQTFLRHPLRRKNIKVVNRVFFTSSKLTNIHTDLRTTKLTCLVTRYTPKAWKKPLNSKATAYLTKKRSLSRREVVNASGGNEVKGSYYNYVRALSRLSTLLTTMTFDNRGEHLSFSSSDTPNKSLRSVVSQGATKVPFGFKLNQKNENLLNLGRFKTVNPDCQSFLWSKKRVLNVKPLSKTQALILNKQNLSTQLQVKNYNHKNPQIDLYPFKFVGKFHQNYRVYYLPAQKEFLKKSTYFFKNKPPSGTKRMSIQHKESNVSSFRGSLITTSCIYHTNPFIKILPNLTLQPLQKQRFNEKVFVQTGEKVEKYALKNKAKVFNFTEPVRKFAQKNSEGLIKMKRESQQSTQHKLSLSSRELFSIPQETYNVSGWGIWNENHHQPFLDLDQRYIGLSASDCLCYLVNRQGKKEKFHSKLSGIAKVSIRTQTGTEKNNLSNWEALLMNVKNPSSLDKVYQNLQLQTLKKFKLKPTKQQISTNQPFFLASLLQTERKSHFFSLFVQKKPKKQTKFNIAAISSAQRSKMEAANRLKTCTQETVMNIKIQAGWIYVSCETMSIQTKKDLTSFHEKVFYPGKRLLGDVMFEKDRTLTKCISLKELSNKQLTEKEFTELQEKQNCTNPFKEITEIIKNKKIRFNPGKVKKLEMPCKPNLPNKNSSNLAVLILPMQYRILPNIYFYKRKIYLNKKRVNEPSASSEIVQRFHSNLLNKQKADKKFIPTYPGVDFKLSFALEKPTLQKKIASRSSSGGGFWNFKKSKNPLLVQKSEELEKVSLETSRLTDEVKNSLQSQYLELYAQERLQPPNHSIKLHSPKYGNASLDQSYFSHYPVNVFEMEFTLEFSKAMAYPFQTPEVNFDKPLIFNSNGKNTTNVLKSLLSKTCEFAQVRDQSLTKHSEKNKKMNTLPNLEQKLDLLTLSVSVTSKMNYFANQRLAANVFTNQALKNTSKPNFLDGLQSFLAFPIFKNYVVFNPQKSLRKNQTVGFTSFLSPTEGEILPATKNRWLGQERNTEMLVLTKDDLFSVSLNEKMNTSTHKIARSNSLAPFNETITKSNLTRALEHFNQTFIEKENQLKKQYNVNIFKPNDTLIHHGNKLYKVKGLKIGSVSPYRPLRLGTFMVYGDVVLPGRGLDQAGQIIHMNCKKITLRYVQAISASPNGLLHAYNGEYVEKNSPVITLPFQTLKTGDIVQGIPKVEQYFEARTSKAGRLFRDSLPNLLQGLFQRYRSFLSPKKAVRQSILKIQQIIVDGVQRVYRSQGVGIVDKHLEIVVRQMTAKVQIVNAGQTGFFPGELFDLEFIEHVNRFLLKKIQYEPVVLGITRASLEVDSFLSAASFQQTTKILSKAAIARKKDFLKGLKENLMTGNLIPAGTGYLVYLKDLPELSK